MGMVDIYDDGDEWRRRFIAF